MACLIEAFYRHSLLTPLTSPWASSHPAGRMRKIKFALLSEQFVARDEQHGFSLRGVNPILARTSVFFPPSSAVARFAPIAPPPTGRLCARPVGGGPVRRLLCSACRSPVPAAGRFGRATWSIDFLLEKKSGVRYHYKMFICVHSCKDTLSFSYRSLSLSLSSSSVDRCVVE